MNADATRPGWARADPRRMWRGAPSEIGADGDARARPDQLAMLPSVKNKMHGDPRAARRVAVSPVGQPPRRRRGRLIRTPAPAAAGEPCRPLRARAGRRQPHVRAVWVGFDTEPIGSRAYTTVSAAVPVPVCARLNHIVGLVRARRGKRALALLDG